MPRDLIKIIWSQSKEGPPKSWVLTSLRWRLLLAALALLLIFAGVMSWGFFHYRSQSQLSQQALIGDWQQEKAQLVSKLGSLQGSLERMEQFTQRLENSVGVESGKLKMGVGPEQRPQDSQELDHFLTKINTLPQLSAHSLAQDWRKGKFDEQFYDKLSIKLDELQDVAANLEVRVHEVYEASEDSLSFWASNPSAWPVQGWVTSSFGYRISPWAHEGKMHQGIDIAAPYGSAIFAPSDGVVTYASYKGGYGLTLMIDHGYGLSTLYGHTSELFVQEGARVRRGQKLAAVGMSGASTGPHLHYEVHVDGMPADPMKFIAE